MLQTLALLTLRTIKRSLRNVLGIETVRQDVAELRSDLRWLNGRVSEEMPEQLPREWLSRAAITREDPRLTYSIDEFFAFRQTLFLSGWCVHEKRSLNSIFIVFTSHIYRFPVTWLAGLKFLFSMPISIPGDQEDANIAVGFEYSDGHRFLIEHPFHQPWGRDPYHRMFATFNQKVIEIGHGSILEIGSRARSGNLYTEFIPSTMKYIGLDVVSGPNVDVVGDAHQLSRYFHDSTFDAAFSIAVFEHLLMPWKVAIELNKVMKKGGILFISTHQAFPLHDEPWDFWRYSDKAWHGLFNEYTGFEVVDAEMGERAYIVGSFLNGMTYRLDEQRAFMVSTVICRKISNCTLEWPVDLDRVIQSSYPH